LNGFCVKERKWIAKAIMRIKIVQKGHIRMVGKKGRAPYGTDNLRTYCTSFQSRSQSFVPLDQRSENERGDIKKKKGNENSQ